MKQDIAMRWVEALRSDKYKQGRQNLKREINGEVMHCCLGVLCELFTDVGSWDEDDVLPCGGHNFNIDGGKHAGIPPLGVVQRAGLVNATCWLAVGQVKIADKEYISLTDANDNGTANFTEIADFIQKNWEIL